MASHADVLAGTGFRPRSWAEASPKVDGTMRYRPPLTREKSLMAIVVSSAIHLQPLEFQGCS